MTQYASAIFSKTILVLVLFSASFGFAQTELPVDGGDPATPEKISIIVSKIKVKDISPEQLSRVLLGFAAKNVDVPQQLLDASRSYDELRPTLGKSILSTIERLLVDRDPATLKLYRSLSEELLPPADSSRTAIQRLFWLAGRAHELLQNRNTRELISLREQATSTTERKIVSARLAQLQLKLASDFQMSKQPINALRELAQIPAEFFNKGAVELTSAMIEMIAQSEDEAGVTLEQSWPFDDPNLQGLLKTAQAADAQTKLSLAGIYSKHCLRMFEKGDVSTAKRYFDLTVSLRADPNDENDKLRYQIALTADSDDAWYFAMGRAKELGDSQYATLGMRTRLLLKGYYGSLYPILFYVSIVLLVLAGILTIVNPSLRLGSKFKMPKISLSNKTEPGYARVATAPDEYSRLLAILGLDDTAKESDIKKAYRKLVKDCHPDRISGSSPQEKQLIERFRHYTETYERLLEIRSAWFGG